MPKMRRNRPNDPMVGSPAALKMEAGQLKADRKAGSPSKGKAGSMAAAGKAAMFGAMGPNMKQTLKSPDVGRSGNRKVKKAGLGGHKGY